jgi:hypothetical protein
MNNERLIEMAQTYFGEGVNINHHLLVEIEQRNSSEHNVIVVPEGLPNGHTRLQGLLFLLRSKNIYPVGNRVGGVRVALAFFDSLPAQVNNPTGTWRQQRETAIRYFWLVHDHMADIRVLSHGILGKGRKVDKSFITTKIWIASLLIFRVSYGWYRTPTRYGGILALDRMALMKENELVHNLMVKPLIQFFCLEMDPHKHLCPSKILRQDLRKLELRIKTKSKEHGIWSQTEALRRIDLDENHPERITAADRFMLSGIEYKFAHLFSLIIKEFRRPWNPRLEGATRGTDSCWLTEFEKSTFYKSLDNDCVVVRFGEPNHEP